MDTETKRKNLEKAILQIMLQKLETGQMDANRARDIAKMVIKILPKDITLGEYYRVVPKLNNAFAELADAVIPVLREYEEKVTMTVRTKVEEMIKKGDFDSAAALASETINKIGNTVGDKSDAVSR